MSDDDWTKAARARCEAATPGPWTTQGSPRTTYRWVRLGALGSPLVASDGAYANRLADIEFIAAARTDLPRALDEIERLRAERDEAVAAHEDDPYDHVLGVVDYLRTLPPAPRRVWMENLLDHVCCACGAELGKAMKSCDACGAPLTPPATRDALLEDNFRLKREAANVWEATALITTLRRRVRRGDLSESDVAEALAAYDAATKVPPP